MSPVTIAKDDPADNTSGYTKVEELQGKAVLLAARGVS